MPLLLPNRTGILSLVSIIADEVATLVVMLASPRTANLTGSNCVIDDGLIKTI
jgi:hypothetical protein